MKACHHKWGKPELMCIQVTILNVKGQERMVRKKTCSKCGRVELRDIERKKYFISWIERVQHE